MALPYAKELLIGQLAVQRASLATKHLLRSVDQGTKSKANKTVVTIADFAAQALLIGAIHHNFPSDEIIGEESSDSLRQDPSLMQKVWELVSTTQLDDAESDKLLWTPNSADEMCDIIDLGSGKGGREGRIWVLDPVDGTAAFLRDQQYAVCLALLKDGHEQIGVLGCPNLNLDGGKVREDLIDKDGYGLMLSAAREQGSFIRPISSGALQPARRIERPNNVKGDELHWVNQSLNPSGDLVKYRKVVDKFGATWPGTELYSCQMRYVALAAGGDNIIVTIPKNKGKKDWIWDHAGGHLILQEAGGNMTDIRGKELDFGRGRSMDGNVGRLAVPAVMRADVLKVVAQLLEEE